ncbi:hypothetical protein MRX96_012776 [Rhipicephalus microplus]
MHLPAYGEGRRTEPTAYPRRPDVLVHHPHHHLTEQDLLGLHGAAAGLPPGIVDDGQTSPCSSDDGNDFLEQRASGGEVVQLASPCWECIAGEERV